MTIKREKSLENRNNHTFSLIKAIHNLSKDV